MYDVVVVGARCAGSPTAMLLARAGVRVLMLDRVNFPADTVSTHFLHPAGIAHLASWGLLPALLATGVPEIREMTFDLADDVVVRAAPLPAGEITYCLGPRRTALDLVLVESAVAAGVEFRADCSVRGPLWDGGRAAGVTFTSGGRTFAERASVVIGADGKHSPFARAVDAKTYREKEVISCLFYGYWSGLPFTGSRAIVRDGRAVFAFPTNDGHHCVVVGWPRSCFEQVKQDIDSFFVPTIAELAPEVHAAMARGEQSGRIVGAGDLLNLYRDSAGPGWALVGDAGHTRDPASAHGIGNAFDQAVALAERVPAALDLGPAALDAALAACAAERDRNTAESFETNAGFATWTVPDEMLAVLRGVQHEPALSTRFLGVYAGRVPMETFLSEVAR